MSEAPSIEHATGTVRAIAHARGIECTPLVIADRSNLVLRLDPHPIVARVAMATSMVRIGMQWLAREMDVSRWLDARGVAVTRPCASIDPGPIEESGLVVSFWELEAIIDEIDHLRAGAVLAGAHRALADMPHDRLPVWGGWEEARGVLERARPKIAAWARVERAWERGERIVESARSRTASFQAVHGDAHLGNVLRGARGPVWTDWEDAFIGPVEWDLACLRSRLDLFGEDREAIERACAGYDREHDRDLVIELALCRNLQVIPWLAIFAERDASLLPRMQARIERLP
jgi:hypothetical protein